MFLHRSIDSFSKVVEGYPVPVVIAGGRQMYSDMDILNMVADPLAAGGYGVPLGRNVFQHRDVQGVMCAISDICLKGFTAKEAYEAHLSPSDDPNLLRNTFPPPSQTVDFSYQPVQTWSDRSRIVF